MATSSLCPTCGSTLPGGASSAGLCPACLLGGLLSDNRDAAGEPEGRAYLEAGTMLGPFRIVGLLGVGGMATVYQAYDSSLERDVALKVLPPEFLHEESFARRFRQEARVIARLEHPNIVPIYASGIDQGIPWMSMRLLGGGSLGAAIGRARPTLEQTVRMLRGVADALDYAHARGIVHRDIKPTNILLDSADRVCVADFGLAYMMDLGLPLTRSGTVAGTPQYMAPEQGLGKTIDHRSDIYSLGVVAFEMLTGAAPFTADSPVAVLLKHVNEPAPPVAVSAAPVAVARAVQKALEKDPESRWQSAGEFVRGLEHGLATADNTVHVVVERRGRLAWVAGTLALAALIAAAFSYELMRPRAAAVVEPLVAKFVLPQGSSIGNLPGIESQAVVVEKSEAPPPSASSGPPLQKPAIQTVSLGGGGVAPPEEFSFNSRAGRARERAAAGHSADHQHGGDKPCGRCPGWVVRDRTPRRTDGPAEARCARRCRDAADPDPGGQADLSRAGKGGADCRQCGATGDGGCRWHGHRSDRSQLGPSVVQRACASSRASVLVQARAAQWGS